MLRFLYSSSNGGSSSNDGTTSELVENERSFVLVSLNHASERAHAEDLLDGEGSGTSMPSSMGVSGMGGSSGGAGTASGQASLEEAEMERQLRIRANAAFNMPDDPLLEPGERILVASRNVAYRDATFSATGSIFLTNHRLIFHAASIDPVSIARMGSMRTTTARHLFPTQTLAESTDQSIPLALVAQITRTYDSGSSGTYTVELSLKDNRTVRIGGFANERAYVKMMQMAFPESYQNTPFAFTYCPTDAVTPETDGWNVYQATREWARLGVPRSLWRFTTLNDRYELCPTYPRHLVVPAQATDDLVIAAARFRSQSRFPVLCWLHETKGGILCRAAQPTAGFGRRSGADEELIELFWLSCGTAASRDSSTSHAILDARPRVNAEVNRASGGGYELMFNYTRTEIEFLGVDNIHVMRESYRKLTAVCAPTNTNDDSFWSDLENTDWHKHLRTLLAAVVRTVRMVESGRGVLVHCSDGWDRTPQITSLAMLCMDPYYRTRNGFAVLIEKEWLSFGHKFHDRIGHAKLNPNDVERSPIFLQFLDAVWQIMHQYPLAFEFNELFLLAILDESYACRFGTFLYNTERERLEAGLVHRTVSVWTSLCSVASANLYTNAMYRPMKESLVPSSSSRLMDLWRSLHLRHTHMGHTTGSPVVDLHRGALSQQPSIPPPPPSPLQPLPQEHEERTEVAAVHEQTSDDGF